MKIAFCIFNYFPFGGLQRDFAKIILATQRLGHTIDVYTMDWQGDSLDGVTIIRVPVRAWSNHRKAMQFAQHVEQLKKTGQYDVVVGFNKMPGLDICFVGDVCLKARLDKKCFFYRLLPRYRYYLQLEEAVFCPTSKTKIFLLTEQQRETYQRCYQTPTNKFYLLPAGIAKNVLSIDEMRAIKMRIRQSLVLSSPDTKMLLFVATHFHTKGLDRAIRALSTVQQNVVLCVIGENKRQKDYVKLATQLGVDHRVCWLGNCPAVYHYFIAADLLVHPARVEAAGMVLIEALTAGLPVLTTAVCGYAYHIRAAQAGMILSEPFSQSQLNEVLQQMLDAQSDWVAWGENALNYAKKTDFYSLADRAAALIAAEGKG